jgi:hypothetical protein
MYKLSKYFLFLGFLFLLNNCKNKNKPYDIMSDTSVTNNVKNQQDYLDEMNEKMDKLKEMYNTDYILREFAAGPFVIGDRIPTTNDIYLITKETHVAQYDYEGQINEEGIDDGGYLEKTKYLVSKNNEKMLYLIPDDVNKHISNQNIQSIEIISSKYKICRIDNPEDKYSSSYSCISIGSSIKDLKMTFPNAEYFSPEALSGYGAYLFNSKISLLLDNASLIDENIDYNNLNAEMFHRNTSITGITIYGR